MSLRFQVSLPHAAWCGSAEVSETLGHPEGDIWILE